VKSTVTYGAETWKSSKNLESKLMSMEMNFFKRLENIEIMLLETKWILKIQF
jgi:hypothetical protein